jgi:integrase
MTTFKICVRTQRKDGLWPVYIRVTHDRQVGYLRTDKIVSSKGLNKAGEVSDVYVVTGLSRKIMGYLDQLNREDTDEWTVAQIISFLTGTSSKITFSKYMHQVIDKLYSENRMGTYKHKSSAVFHLEKFAGKNIQFREVTPSLLQSWKDSMKFKETTLMAYLCIIRKMWHDAMAEYNDPTTGNMLIRTDPFAHLDISYVRANVKRAIPPKDCRRFFSTIVHRKYMTRINAEFVRDVAMLSFCLAGMNAADLYNLKKTNYKDGIIHYNRKKTMGRRQDKAYFEIRVPAIVYPLMEKYATPPECEWLFNFHDVRSEEKHFVMSMSNVLRLVGESLNLSEKLCFYTFRHTWATYAQNYCGASIGDVAFALNHTMKDQVTRGYIKLNFEPVWELNDKVIDFVFFQNEDEVEEERELRRQEYIISPKVQVHGSIYYRGSLLGEVEDRGYHSEEEVIEQLQLFIDDRVPKGSIVQYKIELETGASRVYCRTRE